MGWVGGGGELLSTPANMSPGPDLRWQGDGAEAGVPSKVPGAGWWWGVVEGHDSMQRGLMTQVRAGGQTDIFSEEK